MTQPYRPTDPAELPASYQRSVQRYLHKRDGVRTPIEFLDPQPIPEVRCHTGGALSRTYCPTCGHGMPASVHTQGR